MQLSFIMKDILIVEDNKDIGDLMSEFLTSEGYWVRMARNGEEGLIEMGRKLPDLILLDIEMPVLDGPGMALKIIIHDAGYEDIPIIILSGVADIEQVAARVGTPHYLTKPFRVDLLMKKIEQALLDGRGIRQHTGL